MLFSFCNCCHEVIKHTSEPVRGQPMDVIEMDTDGRTSCRKLVRLAHKKFQIRDNDPSYLRIIKIDSAFLGPLLIVDLA